MNSVLALCLLAFVGSVIGGPLNAGRNSQCSHQCRESVKFHYQPGTVYEYRYEGSVSNSVNGISDQKSGLTISAKAKISFISSCEVLLKLTDVALQEVHPTTGTRASSPATQAFRQALEAYPLKFTFQDGVVESVCAAQQEEEWVTNIKRALLSSFQNSMTDLGTDTTVEETDITGKCPAEYRVGGSGWSRSFTVTKTKNLMSCSNRDGFRTALQATPYRVASDIQSLPLLKSSHFCEQTIHNNGYLLKSVCREDHVFRPFSRGNSGARTEAAQILEFIGEHTEGPTMFTHPIRRTDLLFRNDDINKAKDLIGAKAVLNEICRSTDIRPETPKLFSDLVYQMKGLDRSAITSLHGSIESNRVCSSNHQSARKFFYDALAMTGTSSAVELMSDLLKQRKVTGSEAEMWLTTLAFVQKPTKEMITAVKPLLEQTEVSRTTYLSISALINNYCKDADCQTDSAVTQIVRRLEGNLNGNCQNQNREKTLMSLKALANIETSGARPTLNRCVMETSNNIEIRLSALDALRRQPCTVNRDVSMRVFADVNEDAEIRIAAYLATMECANRETFELVHQVLENEQVNQVGSFVWTHLTNLMETSDPHKQQIRAILENQTLKKEFNMDKRKFSRNVEGSVFFDSVNMGAKAEANLIWSPKSFLPRSAMMNLNLDLFGKTVNLLEVGGRAEGMEILFEKFFGPKGYFPDSTVSRNLRQKQRSFNENLMAEKERQYKSATGTTEPQGSVYFKIFGNEIRYADIADMMKAESLNILDILIKLAHEQEYDYTKSLMFLDTTVTVPTVLGLPLKLAVNGTATVNVKLSGKMDLRQFGASPRSLEIDGIIKPSSAVEISCVMGVDAFYTRSGLKMENTLHSSTELNGKVSLKNGEIFLANINMPNEKMELLSVSNKLFMIHRDEEIPTTNKVGTPFSKRMCSGDEFAKITGVEFCGELEYFNTFGLQETPLFPLNGNSRVSVVMNKKDSHDGYTMEARMEKRKTRTGGRQEVSYISRLAFNTPNSRVDREVSVDFRLRPSQRHLSFELVSPWKRASLNGIIQNQPDLKKAELLLTLDRTLKYGVTSHVTIGRKTGRVTFSPRAELHLGSRPPVVLSGSMDLTHGRKLDMDLTLNNLIETPMTLKGAIEKDIRRSRYNTLVELKSPWVNSKVQGYVENKFDTYKSRMTFDYSLMESARVHQLVTNYKIRHLQSATTRTISANIGLRSTQYPEVDFQATLEAQKAPRHVESSLKVNYGDSKMDQHLVDTGFVMRYDPQPDGSIKADASAKFIATQLGADANMKLEHRHSNSKLRTKLNMNLSPVKQMSAEVSLQNLSTNVIHLTADATLMLPEGRSYSFSHQFEERKVHEYHHNMFAQWETGRQVQTTTVLKKNEDNYSMKFTGKIPNYAPLSFMVSTRLNPLTFRTDVDLSLNRRKYSANMDYSLNIEGAHFSFAGNADLTCPHRHVLANVRVNRLGPEVRLEMSTKWDADRDQSKIMEFVSFYRVKETRRSKIHDGSVQLNYMGKKYEATVSSKLNDQISTGSLLFKCGSHFADVKTSLDMSTGITGKLTMTSSCTKMPAFNAQFNHQGSMLAFSSEAEATWADKKMAVSITSRTPDLKNMNVVVRVQSPCPKYSEVVARFQHSLQDNTIVTSLNVEMANERYTAQITGSVSSSSLKTEMKIVSPFTIHPIVGSLHYDFTVDAFVIKFNAEAGGEQAAAVLKVKPEWQNFDIKFQVITPFDRLKKAGFELGNVMSGEELSGVATIEYNDRKAGLSLVGRMKNQYRNMEATAKISIPIPGYNDLGLSLKYHRTMKNIQVESSIAWSSEHRYAAFMITDYARSGMCTGKISLEIPMRQISYNWDHAHSTSDLKSVHTITIDGVPHKMVIEGEVPVESTGRVVNSRISTHSEDPRFNVIVSNSLTIRTAGIEVKSTMAQADRMLYNAAMEMDATDVLNYNLEARFENAFTIPVRVSLKSQSIQAPYNARVEVKYGEKRVVADVLCKHLSYRNFEYTVRFQTPCRYIRNGQLRLMNVIESKAINTAFVVTHNSEEYEINLMGSKDAGDNNLSGTITLKMPRREPMSLMMKHADDGREYSSNIELTYEGRRQASAMLTMTHQRQGWHIQNRGSISVSSPFEGFSNIAYRWQHNHDDSQVVSKHTALYDERSGVFNVEANWQNVQGTVTYNAKSVLHLPTDTVGRVEFTMDYESSVNHLKSDITLKQNTNSVFETSVSGRMTSTNVQGETRINLPNSRPASMSMKVSRNFPYTTHIEATWQNDKHFVFDARSSSTDLYNIDMSLNVATPFRGYERISSSFKQVYRNGQFRHNSFVKYNPRKQVTIEAISESYPTVRRTLSITTPCRYLTNLVFSADSATARLEFNGLENMKVEASIQPEIKFELSSSLPSLRHLQATTRFSGNEMLIKMQREPAELIHIEGKLAEESMFLVRAPSRYLRELHASASPRAVTINLDGYWTHRLQLRLTSITSHRVVMDLDVACNGRQVMQGDLNIARTPETFNFELNTAKPFHMKQTVKVHVSQGFKMEIDSNCPYGTLVSKADGNWFSGEGSISITSKNVNILNGELDYNTNSQKLHLTLQSVHSLMERLTVNLERGIFHAKFVGREEIEINGEVSDLSLSRVQGNFQARSSFGFRNVEGRLLLSHQNYQQGTMEAIFKSLGNTASVNVNYDVPAREISLTIDTPFITPLTMSAQHRDNTLTLVKNGETITVSYNIHSMTSNKVRANVKVSTPSYATVEASVYLWHDEFRRAVTELSVKNGEQRFTMSSSYSVPDAKMRIALSTPFDILKSAELKIQKDELVFIVDGYKTASFTCKVLTFDINEIALKTEITTSIESLRNLVATLKMSHENFIIGRSELAMEMNSKTSIIEATYDLTRLEISLNVVSPCRYFRRLELRQSAHHIALNFEGFQTYNLHAQIEEISFDGLKASVRCQSSVSMLNNVEASIHISHLRFARGQAILTLNNGQNVLSINGRYDVMKPEAMVNIDVGRDHPLATLLINKRTIDMRLNENDRITVTGEMEEFSWTRIKGRVGIQTTISEYENFEAIVESTWSDTALNQRLHIGPTSTRGLIVTNNVDFNSMNWFFKIMTPFGGLQNFEIDMKPTDMLFKMAVKSNREILSLTSVVHQFSLIKGRAQVEIKTPFDQFSQITAAIGHSYDESKLASYASLKINEKEHRLHFETNNRLLLVQSPFDSMRELRVTLEPNNKRTIFRAKVDSHIIPTELEAVIDHPTWSNVKAEIKADLPHESFRNTEMSYTHQNSDDGFTAMYHSRHPYGRTQLKMNVKSPLSFELDIRTPYQPLKVFRVSFDHVGGLTTFNNKFDFEYVAYIVRCKLSNELSVNGVERITGATRITTPVLYFEMINLDLDHQKTNQEYVTKLDIEYEPREFVRLTSIIKRGEMTMTITSPMMSMRNIRFQMKKTADWPSRSVSLSFIHDDITDISASLTAQSFEHMTLSMNARSEHFRYGPYSLTMSHKMQGSNIDESVNFVYGSKQITGSVKAAIGDDVSAEVNIETPCRHFQKYHSVTSVNTVNDVFMYTGETVYEAVDHRIRGKSTIKYAKNMKAIEAEVLIEKNEDRYEAMFKNNFNERQCITEMYVKSPGNTLTVKNIAKLNQQQEIFTNEFNLESTYPGIQKISLQSTHNGFDILFKNTVNTEIKSEVFGDIKLEHHFDAQKFPEMTSYVEFQSTDYLPKFRLAGSVRSGEEHTLTLAGAVNDQQASIIVKCNVNSGYRFEIDVATPIECCRKMNLVFELSGTSKNLRLKSIVQHTLLNMPIELDMSHNYGVSLNTRVRMTSPFHEPLDVEILHHSPSATKKNAQLSFTLGQKKASLVGDIDFNSFNDFNGRATYETISHDKYELSFNHRLDNSVLKSRLQLKTEEREVFAAGIEYDPYTPKLLEVTSSSAFYQSMKLTVVNQSGTHVITLNGGYGTTPVAVMGGFRFQSFEDFSIELDLKQPTEMKTKLTLTHNGPLEAFTTKGTLESGILGGKAESVLDFKVNPLDGRFTLSTPFLEKIEMNFNHRREVNGMETSFKIDLGQSTLIEIVNDINALSLNQLNVENQIRIPPLNVDVAIDIMHQLTETTIKDSVTVRVLSFGLYGVEIEASREPMTASMTFRLPKYGQYKAIAQHSDQVTVVKVSQGVKDIFEATLTRNIQSLNEFEFSGEVKSVCRFATGNFAVKHSGHVSNFNTDTSVSYLGHTAVAKLKHNHAVEPLFLSSNVDFEASFTDKVHFNVELSRESKTFMLTGSYGSYTTKGMMTCKTSANGEYKISMNVNVPDTILEKMSFEIHHGGSHREFCNVLTYKSKICGEYKLTTTLGRRLFEIELETPRTGFEKQAIRLECGSERNVLSSGKAEALYDGHTYRWIYTLRNNENMKSLTTRINTPINGFTDMGTTVKLAGRKLTTDANWDGEKIRFIGELSEEDRRFNMELISSAHRFEDASMSGTLLNKDGILTAAANAQFGSRTADFSLTINYGNEPDFRLTVRTPVQNYQFAEISGGYKLSDEGDINANVMLKLESRVIASDLKFKLNPLDAKLSLRTPFQDFEDQSVQMQLKGTKTRFTVDVKVSAMRKEGTFSLSFTNQNNRRIVIDSKLKTPYRNLENMALVFTHNGDLQNLRTQFSLKNRNTPVVEVELTHNERTSSLKFRAPKTRLSLEHNGPWDNCNSAVVANLWNGMRMNIDQTFRKEPLSVELKIRVPGIIDIAVNKQGLLHDHKSRANVKYYGREYQLLSELMARNSIKGKILLTTPHSAISHCHLQISHDGGLDMANMKSKISWLHNQQKMFEVNHQRHTRGGSLRVQVLRNSMTIIHNGPWLDSTTNFEFNFANGVKVIADQKFVLDPLEASLTVRMPGKMDVKLYHKGMFPNFRSSIDSVYMNKELKVEAELNTASGLKSMLIVQSTCKYAKYMKLVYNFKGSRNNFDTSGVAQWNPTDKVFSRLTVDVEEKNINAAFQMETPYSERTALLVKHENMGREVKSAVEAMYGSQQLKFSFGCDRSKNGYIKLSSPFPHLEDVSMNVQKIRISNSNGYRIRVSLAPGQEIAADVSIDVNNVPITGYLKLTTPFEKVQNMIINAEHQMTNAMLKQKLNVILNSRSVWDSTVDATMDEKSFNSEIITKSPKAMKYTVQFINDEKLKKLEVNLDWDSTTRGSNVYVVAEHKDQSAYYRTKRDNTLRITVPTRTIAITQIYENSRIKTNHIFEVMWNQNQRVKLHLGHVDESRSYQNAYRLFGILETPIRTMKTTYKHQATDQKYEGALQAMWDAGRFPNKIAEISMTYQLEGQTHVVQVALNHPVLSQPIVIRNEVDLNLRDVICSAKTTIEYSNDPEEKLLLVGNLRDVSRGRHENITMSMQISHAKTLTSVKLSTHLGNTASAASMGLAVDYQMTSRKQKTLQMYGEIDKLRKALMSEMRTDTMVASLSGNFERRSNGFDASLAKNFNGQTTNTKLAVNTDYPSFTVMNVDSANPGKTYHASGTISKTDIHIQAYRMNNGLRVTDGEFSVRLNSSRVLRTVLRWQPRNLQDLKTGLIEYMTMLRGRMNVALNTASNTVFNELMERVEIMKQLMPNHEPIVRFINDELESFRADYELMKAALNRMYERNEFHSQDIYLNSVKAINYIKEHTARLQYRLRTKFAEIRRSIQIRLSSVRRVMDDLAGRLEEAIAGFVLKFRPAWQSYAYSAIRQAQVTNMMVKHQAELLTERLAQYKDSMVNYLDNKFDHVTYKIEYYFDQLIDLQERARFYLLSDKQKTYLDNITERVTNAWQRLRTGAWSLKELAMRKADQMLEVAERITLRKLEETFGREYIDQLTYIADEFVDELKSTYEQWDIDEDLRRLALQTLEKLADEVRRQGRLFAQKYFRIGRTGFTVFNPENGHIEADIFLPLDLESLDTVPTIDIDAWKNELRTMKEKYFPKRGYSIWDTYYRYKPSSDMINWIPPFKTHASVFLGQNFRTFDGRYYSFAGTCSYVLAKVFDEPDFSVVAHYNRGALTSYSIISDGREITLTVYPDFKIKLDQSDVELPIQFTHTSVIREKNMIHIANARGMKFECDLNRERCTLYLSGWYYNKVGGLFGTYDNEPFNDFSTPQLQRESLDRFAQSWQVGRSCPRSHNMAISQPTGENHDCKKMFVESSSPLGICFNHVRPEPFNEACNKMVAKNQDRRSVCNVVGMYVKECRMYGVDIEYPAEACSSCASHVEEEINPSNNPSSQTADVIFVVEEKECNRHMVNKLGTIAMSIKRELKKKGFRENRFAMVGFGGNGVDRKPHTHTMRNQLFGSAEILRLATGNMEIINQGSKSDVVEAVNFAADYPFRIGVSKNIVLLPCTSCRSSIHKNFEQFLNDRDITLHVLQADNFQMNDNTANIIGVDGSTAFTTRDALSVNLVGNMNLFRQINILEKSCADLALQTGGSAFNSLKMTGTRDDRQFIDVLARRIALTATPKQRQLCQCQTDKNGWSQTKCRAIQIPATRMTMSTPVQSPLLGHMGENPTMDGLVRPLARPQQVSLES